MSNNSTLDKLPEYHKITWTVAYSLQFFVAMIGNFLIVWIVNRDNRLKTTTNYLISNMAVSDLIGGLLGYPLYITLINFDNQWLIGGDIGNALCKLIAFSLETTFTVSINSCIAIAVDRYYAVVRPFKRPFQGKMKHVITCIWIIAAVFNSPYLYTLATIEYGGVVFCTVSPKNLSFARMNSYIRFVFNALLLPVLTTTYTLTICRLFRHKVPGLPTSERRRRDQQNKKVLKQCVTIVILLYLCRGLHFIVMFLFFQEKLHHLSFSQQINLWEISYFMLFFSLVCNFFVYLIFNDVYRENIKALIPKKCCCRANINRRQEIPAEGEMIEMQVMN